MESLVKALLKSDSEPREYYLKVIDAVLLIGLDKYNMKNCKNVERIRWGRLLIQSIVAGNMIIRDNELEEIEERLSVLEDRFKNE